jgi:hypothetical protein
MSPNSQRMVSAKAGDDKTTKDRFNRYLRYGRSFAGPMLRRHGLAAMPTNRCPYSELLLRFAAVSELFPVSA